MSKEIYTKIVEAFDADTNLSTMFAGGLFNDIAGLGETLPVCVIYGISEVSTYTTCDEINELRIQFSIFTTTDVQCFDGLEYLKAEFDEKNLGLINTNLIRMQRVGGIPPRKIDGNWQGILEYIITTQV